MDRTDILEAIFLLAALFATLYGTIIFGKMIGG